MSALLAVLMMMGTVTVATSAAIPLLPAKNDSSIDYEDTIDVYLGSTSSLNNSDNSGKQVKYNTPQEKLAGMAKEPIWESHGYQLWIDEVTGEVATVKVSTGEILFTNPWNTQDASYTNGSNTKSTSLTIKKQLLSQIIINYVDNDNDKTMYSCIDAAARDQINVEYITDGIRVEYSIGEENTRMLVPRAIKVERFEQKILQPAREFFKEATLIISDGTIRDENGNIVMKNTDVWTNKTFKVGQSYKWYEAVLIQNPEFKMDAEVDLIYDHFEVRKIASYYTRKDVTRASSAREEAAIRTYLINGMGLKSDAPVYIFDPTASSVEQLRIERRIKDYVPSYTYEELDFDHEDTGYVGVDKQPPLFKMALEYTLDENGMSVRLPANGIRFDQSLYQLTSIEMLPYMGAGANDGDFSDGGDGYTFFPDGSGALFDFQQLNTGANKTISGKIYGQDYAYHEISGTHQEVIRYPAFGIVEKWTGNKTVTDYENVIKEATYDSNGKELTAAEYGTKVDTVNEDRGFLAIIEEGDALAELSTYHMSATSIYNTVRMIFYPRPKDSYNMADALSVGTNTKMTVVSNRKYVGSYKVRYIMLSDDTLAAENNLSSYYEASWMGMAVAYRDYLESSGVLERLNEADVDDDIPLYIETFGAVWSTEKILSIPVDVMTPLTSFEDVKTMYSELSSAIEAAMKATVDSEENVGSTDESTKEFSNLNFKLTGYANGGMYSTVPGNLNWEAAVGGASGFRDLVDYSKEEGFDVFPDFDFVYINMTDVLDGVNLKTDAVKTIDNRYTGRREYSATLQTYQGYFGLAIAPSCFEKFVTKLTTNYLKYNPTGISVSTFGTDLNSDFDEEDPLNREDSKQYTIDALKQLANLSNNDGNSIKIMTDGGNAYTWRYVDYIVNMPLNSSRYNISSNAVPFIGVVLHGYLQFAGTPINEEGDIEYAFLKAIENGAGLYFTLSYQNTQILKEYTDLSQYFSVRYDIWKDDVVDMYVELNDLLCDLQTKLIIDHDFLVGDRIPDDSEYEEDMEAIQKAEDLKEAAATIEAIKQALKEALAMRHTPTESVEKIESALNDAGEQVKLLSKNIAKLDVDYVTDCADAIRQVKNAEAAVAEAKKTTVNSVAYDAALDAVDTQIGNALIDKSVVESDKLAADASADAKAIIANVQKQLVKKAIDVAVAEAVRVAVANIDKTYTSTAEENADIKAKANDIIKAVSDAIDALGQNIVNSAADKTMAQKAVDAVKTGIVSGLSNGIAAEAYTTAKTAYNASILSIEENFTIAVDSYVTIEQLKKTAVEMGITKDAIEKAMSMNGKQTELNLQLNAANVIKTDFAAKIVAICDAVNKYYDNLKNIIDRVELKDDEGKTISNELKVDLKNLVNSYQKKAIYDIYALTESEKLTEDVYAADRESSLTSYNTANKPIQALTPERKAAAEAMFAKLEAAVGEYVTDAEDLYTLIVNEINSYYDVLEKSYTKYSREEFIADAAKIINDNKRYTEIADVALAFLQANNDSFNAEKAYAQAIADLNASTESLNALLLDETLTKRANNAIAIGDTDESVTKLNRLTYNQLKYYIDAASGMNVSSTLEDEYADDVDEYIENAILAETLAADIDAVKEELRAEEITVAKAAADALLKEKRSAYEAKAKGEKASAVTALIDKVTQAQANYDEAEAAYLLIKAMVLPHDNATDAEIKAYSTADEIKDYNSKLAEFNNARNKLESAKQALDKLIADSTCQTELNELIEAYKAQQSAYNKLKQITAIRDTLIQMITAENSFVIDDDAEALLDDAKAAALKRAEITAVIGSSSSYVTTSANAFSALAGYLASAELDLNSAKAATEELKARVESTKVEKEAADWIASIYEIAVVVATYRAGEIKTLADNSEEGTLKEIYTRAYIVATTDIAELEAAANASTEDKSEAKLIFEAAKAYNKHSNAGLIELNESYQYKKITAQREMSNAQEFYEIAVSDTQQAQAKYDELKAIYDTYAEKYNSYEVLGASVLLFGDTTLDSIKNSSIGDMKIANDIYDIIAACVELVASEWAKINENMDAYNAAKAEYEALLAVDISKLTEAEKETHQAQLVNCSYKMMSAETAINTAKELINTEYLANFKDNYIQIATLIESILSYEAQAKSYFEAAEAFYDLVKDDASVSADTKNDAKEAYEKAKAFYDLIEANNDKFVSDDGAESAFDKIFKQAYDEFGLIVLAEDETTGELKHTTPETLTKLDDFVNEFFINNTKVEVKEETKYTCNDGSIVAVTYGGNNGNDAEAYRTFLLNFNSFRVTVNYNGNDYEIDGYGYLVIDHN